MQDHADTVAPTTNHVLPYEDALQMAAEMLGRVAHPEEINGFDFKWCVHSVPPKGANLWRFHMELVSETRTKVYQ